MIENNEVNKNSKGGTELMVERLENSVPPNLLSKFQIIPSRVRNLDPTKVRVLWLHDLPHDPESKHLANEGWRKFHRLVFVSHWQMQAYINTYNIPYSRCVVIQNAIIPIEKHTKPTHTIRLGYWSTPHRGLEILVRVFEKLAEKYDNIELDVFSSFQIYGWPERDKQYDSLYQRCRDHSRINYYGSVDNQTLREKIKEIHILAYPSIWVETSCMVLMEAMSGGCHVVHSNLGALPETAANYTNMYQFDEDPNRHAKIFYDRLAETIEIVKSTQTEGLPQIGKAYSDLFYNWQTRKDQWINFLESIQDVPTGFETINQNFVYRVI